MSGVLSSLVDDTALLFDRACTVARCQQFLYHGSWIGNPKLKLALTERSELIYGLSGLLASA